MKIVMEPIAYASNERLEIEDDHWGEVISTITLVKELPASVLEAIELFSHLEIVYYFHKVKEEEIIRGARHPRNNKAYPLSGIFSQRGKKRPNRIGLTTVELIGREERCITVKGLDCINGTPILDIKPVMKEFLPTGKVRQPDWSRDLMKEYWH